MPLRHALGLILVGFMHLSPSPGKAESGYVLTDCRVFDGVEPRIREAVTVTVRGRWIDSITEGSDGTPSELERIDCAGDTLMPGLIDVHTHLESEEAADRALASGVTTIRTAGVSAFQDIALRQLAATGERAGPDVVAAGVYVTPDLENTLLADPRLAPLASGVTTEEQLRLLVQINVDRGVDVIKTRGTERAGRPDTDPRQQVYSQRQLEVIVDEAARRSKAVMVHAHGDEGARAAVLAGARSIEHGTYLSTTTLELMKRNGTWFVPTLVTMLEMNEEQYDHTLRLRGVHMVPVLEAAIREGRRLGVKFATGADNDYNSQSINRPSLEVFHLNRLGFTPFEAMQAATSSAAELLQLERTTGRIAAGFEADLILVRGNPLEDVRVVQDVLMVISNGQLVLKRIPFGRNANG